MRSYVNLRIGLIGLSRRDRIGFGLVVQIGVNQARRVWGDRAFALDMHEDQGPELFEAWTHYFNMSKTARNALYFFFANSLLKVRS